MSEQEEEPWPFFRHPRAYPRPGQTSRADKHERLRADHVQRHRERGVQPPRRDRGLSRAEIVGVAVAVADAEGPEAISMRRIARELGAGVMSLYWYVGSKEELLDLMLESIEAEIEVPEPSGDWRSDLGTFAHRTRAGMELLDLPVRATMDVMATVMTYVIGAVIREAQEIRGQHDQELAEAHLTEEEIQAQRERYHQWFEASGRYPRMKRLLESGVDPDDPKTRDERFAFGLNCLLDGIAAQLPPNRRLG
jgi:AcrR family transcriptional regulator